MTSGRRLAKTCYKLGDGNVVQPKVIIHGGAGSSLSGKGGVEAVRRSLHSIVQQVAAVVAAGSSAVDAVVLGCRLLEDDPRFNAGTGSVLQSDGQIRMSAAVMDGTRQSFSGVVNVSRVQNPIVLAQTLQHQQDRLLSDYGAAELARELQLPLYNPLTEQRLQEWLQDRQGNFSRKMADVFSAEQTGATEKPPTGNNGDAGRGTIGVVVLDSAGNLAAGTSTGGKGFERIGRVSDSATPAGNYANAQAGISCTGIGEDIIDECLAAKIVIRVTDGLSLEQAFQRSLAEALKNGRDLGAIGIDAAGTIAWGKTSEILLAAYHTGQHIDDTLEMNKHDRFGSA
jgi:L-asparaginase